MWKSPAFDRDDPGSHGLSMFQAGACEVKSSSRVVQSSVSFASSLSPESTHAAALRRRCAAKNAPAGSVPGQLAFLCALVWSVADPDGRMGSGIANLNAVTMRKQVGPGIDAESGRERLRIERDRPWTISV